VLKESYEAAALLVASAPLAVPVWLAVRAQRERRLWRTHLDQLAHRALQDPQVRQAVQERLHQQTARPIQEPALSTGGPRSHWWLAPGR
jgi:hypothetical protein